MSRGEIRRVPTNDPRKCVPGVPSPHLDDLSLNTSMAGRVFVLFAENDTYKGWRLIAVCGILKK